MATAIATLQHVWDCRWSRAGHRLTGVSEREQPESLWVCIREGIRRNVSEEECRTCSHFEAVAGMPVRATVAARQAAVATRMAPADVLRFSTQGILIVNALLFVGIGVATLTSPLAVPFTVSMWLCAAAFAGLAAFWPQEESS